MHRIQTIALLLLAAAALLLIGWSTHELCSILAFQDWGCAQPSCTR